MNEPFGTCRGCHQAGSQRTGRAHRCDGCRVARNLYRTTVSNLQSGYNRTKGAPEMKMDVDTFCAWRRQQRWFATTAASLKWTFPGWA